MATEIHHDRSSLAAPIVAKVFEGRVARVHGDGDPLRYSWGDAYRDATELQRIVDQLPGTPFTLNHPEGFISDGTEAHIIGRVIAARIDGEYAVATILVTDEDGVEAIEAGIQELSLGYTARYETHTDEKKYQRDIKLDHLSAVGVGRCGPNCRLRTHSDCQFRDEAVTETVAPAPEPEACGCAPLATTVPTAKHLEVPMADTVISDQKPLLDELQKKLADSLAEAATLKAHADQAQSEIKSLKDSAEQSAIAARELEKDLKAEKARADAAEAAAKASQEKANFDADDEFTKRVAARVEILKDATVVLGAEADATKSDRDLKVAIARHVDGDDAVLDSDSNDAVHASYRGAMKRHAKAVGSRVDARQAIAAVHKDAAVLPMNWRDAERAARVEMTSHDAQAWTK